MTARVGLEIARWVFAFLGWTLLLVSLWERGLVRTLLPSLLKGLGTILGGAGALAIVIAVVQAFFLEKIKGWVEQQRLEITHGQKIVEEMVKQLHDYAHRYYMPLGRTAMQFVNANRRRDWKDAFYFFVLHHYHRNQLTDELGGYFLRDATAEVVLPRLARKVRDAFSSPAGFLEWGELERLASELLPSPKTSNRPEFDRRISVGWGLEKYRQFRELLERNPQQVQVKDAVECLAAYASLLLLEVNLAYGAWYGEIHADLTENAFRTIVETLGELVKHNMLPQEEADAYGRRLGLYVIRPRATA